MSAKRVILLYGCYQHVYAAALMKDEWDYAQFHNSGVTLSEVLDQWMQEGNISQAIILTANILNHVRVAEQFRQLTKHGTSITLFLPLSAKELKRTFADIKNLSVYTEEIVLETAMKLYPKYRDRFSEMSVHPDINSFMFYKFVRAVMEDNFTPLYDVLGMFVQCMERPFEKSMLKPADVEIVEKFRNKDFDALKGDSPLMRELKSRISQIAPTDLRVLIIGETGTGKEAVALYLHEFSDRQRNPFVSINCAGLEEGFLRSELFGHLKGAYTGAIRDRKGLIEVAEGGTLFLDELHEMPLSIQCDLLRFLETGRYRPLGSDEEKQADVRIVAGSLPKILQMVDTGAFRSELYYRLSNVQLHTPSLSEIPEDIIKIIKFKLFQLCDRDGLRKIKTTLEYFMKGRKILKKYQWPGNVRELLHYVKRHFYLGDDVIEEIKQKIQMSLHEATADSYINGSVNSGKITPLKTVLRDYVHHTYKHRGELSQKELAARLGISVNTLKAYIRQSA